MQDPLHANQPENLIGQNRLSEVSKFTIVDGSCFKIEPLFGLLASSDTG